MSWLLVIVAAWVLIAVLLAILIGRGVRRADVEAARIGRTPDTEVSADEPINARPAARTRHELPSARRPLSRPRSPFSETVGPGRPSRRS
ncbi:hypothetical protein [Blastococcus litoris]|uniref:hypothetical protein n=1 Tax=Blastococcus litoris TaxID=2171622 RepID=UPI000E30AE68|nr:hypothetical protein [Blastococcus litoris]